MRTSAVRIGIGLIGLLLASCTALSTRVSNIKQVLGVGQDADDSKLDPAYRYLRVTVSGRSTFVLLGDIDKGPDGSVEIYYSGSGEVLRFQNGRLAGATGLTTEWRRVALVDTPAWATVANGKTAEWKRVRDVMPGYRYNVEERISIRQTAAPGKTALVGIPAASLTWFEEQIASPRSARDMLPPARYAVTFADNRETVVYGEQCLSPALCLAWQTWTPRKQGK